MTTGPLWRAVTEMKPGRRLAPLLAGLLSMLDPVWLATAAAAGFEQPDAIAHLVDAAVAAKTATPTPVCTGAVGAARWPGLTLKGERVVDATLLGELWGYAQSAKTTGGLGGRLTIVTDPRDYDPRKHEPPIADTLRWAVERATTEKEPAWIVFDPKLPPHTRILVKDALRLPDNITLDGSCSDVTLEALSVVNTILIYTKNVIIDRLALRKTDYAPEANPDDDSCIRLNGAFDRIAIVHNDVSQCGDGAIDITVSPRRPIPEAARVTVAYNFIHDHDKTMLFGTFDCPGGPDADICDAAYFAANRSKMPGLFLTLDGNLFLRTGQRHPRVYGRVMAHIVNNLVAFQPTARPDGKFGDAYGVFVSNDARALVEHNFFTPVRARRQHPLAVWTVVTPGAERMPGDVEGFVRLADNFAMPPATADEDRPEEVPEPSYASDAGYEIVPLAELGLAAALACLSDRAGRTGASQWNRNLCAP